MEKKYNVYMDGVVIDRNVTRDEAEELVEGYLDADDFDEEEHYYMIKPATKGGFGGLASIAGIGV